MSDRTVLNQRETITSDMYALQEKGDAVIKLLYSGGVEIVLRKPDGMEVRAFGNDLKTTLRNTVNSLNRMESA